MLQQKKNGFRSYFFGACALNLQCSGPVNAKRQIKPILCSPLDMIDLRVEFARHELTIDREIL
jgi:hypothetical protein